MYLSTLYIFLGRTILMFAAQGGHSEVVKLLLEQNIDVQAKNNDGE